MSNDTTLHITRTFDAPLTKVWDAWTDTDTMKKWWGPKYFTAPHISHDLRVGGKYLYCMHGAPGPDMPEQDFWSAGEFTDVQPEKRLAATDHFAKADGTYINPKEVGMPGEWDEEMTVITEFEETPDGKTKVSITHTGHPKEMMEPATQGWNQQLDKLEVCLKQ